MTSTLAAPWHCVTTHADTVHSAVASAVALSCPSDSRLHDPVTRIVEQHVEALGANSNRFFGMGVLGALTGDPLPAVPVSVVSTLWWSGAEALDDLADSVSGAAVPALLPPSELLVAAIACMELVPRNYIDAAELPAALRGQWSGEMLQASLAAAAGQLADIARDDEALTWARVMTAYVGKSGAAYAREAVMAAQLADAAPEALRGWRAFGQLFGVLRQLHNDNVECGPEDDEDLANGTPTLLLASTLEEASPALRSALLALRQAAMTDLDARAALRRTLLAPDATTGYLRRLAALHSTACSLLDELAAPSIYRDALRYGLNASARRAVPHQERESRP